MSDYMRTARRGVVDNPRIPARERPYIARTIDHRLHVARADLEWTDSQIAALQRA